MISVNINQILKDKNKSKYWLCQKMNITSRNLNRIIEGKTKSISFKYIEDFCHYLDCSPNDLIIITKEEKNNS